MKIVLLLMLWFYIGLPVSAQLWGDTQLPPGFQETLVIMDTSGFSMAQVKDLYLTDQAQFMKTYKTALMVVGLGLDGENFNVEQDKLNRKYIEAHELNYKHPLLITHIYNKHLDFRAHGANTATEKFLRSKDTEDDMVQYVTSKGVRLVTNVPKTAKSRDIYNATYYCKDFSGDLQRGQYDPALNDVAAPNEDYYRRDLKDSHRGL